MFRKPTIRSLLGTRLSTEAFDARLALVACSIAGVGIVPMAILALMRNQGGRAEFFLGLSLAIVTGLIFLTMGLVISHGVVRLAKVPLRRRWAEFAGYLGGIGLLIGGIRALPLLGLGPAGLVLVLLLVVSLSIAVLALGMMSSLCLATKESVSSASGQIERTVAWPCRTLEDRSGERDHRNVLLTLVPSFAPRTLSFGRGPFVE